MPATKICVKGHYLPYYAERIGGREDGHYPGLMIRWVEGTAT